MNFYKRYPGDYGRDTAALSLTAHGVYTVLLDQYYSIAQPLPADLDTLYFVCRANRKFEQDAVKLVADKFFPVGEDGLRHNKRADKEIAAFNEGERQRGEKQENERDRQKRHRERRSLLFEELRSYGEVPAWDTSIPALEALLVTAKSRHPNAPVTRDSPVSVTPPVTHLATANQIPEPEPDKDKRSAANPAARPEEFCKEVIFRVGVPMLVDRGVPEERVRAVLGKYYANHAHREKLMKVLYSMSTHTYQIDPIAYLTKAMQGETRRQVSL